MCCIKCIDSVRSTLKSWKRLRDAIRFWRHFVPDETTTNENDDDDAKESAELPTNSFIDVDGGDGHVEQNYVINDVENNLNNSSTTDPVAAAPKVSLSKKKRGIEHM